MILTTNDIKDAIVAFAHEHDMPTEQGLFLKRKFAETPPWFWAFNALIHWRRGEWQLAVGSWQLAVCHAAMLTGWSIMIVVKVELWSAIDGQKTELARMVIDNIGGNHQLADYRTRTLRGRSKEALDRALNDIPMNVTREGKVTGHARLREHFWNLVAKALSGMVYGQ